MRAFLCAAALALLPTACGRPSGELVRPLCESDAQCGPGLLCFPDGCGDPGSNLAVEVMPNAKGGQHAQDFLIPKLNPVQDFELFPGAFVTGDVFWPSATGALAPYALPVGVRVVGESLLIPGLSRRFEALVTSGDGRFSLPVATGRYTVQLTPADSLLPSQSRRGVQVDHGGTLEVDFTLPSLEALVPVQAKLVWEGGALLDAEMEVQALTVDTKEPLSQPHFVPPLAPDFQLLVAPDTLAAPTYLIRATPRGSPSVPIPSKLFTVSTKAQGLLLLEMGPYGTPVHTSGRVLDGAGKPLASAAVYTQGEVSGGGTFRSESVTTDAEGRFQLVTLPSIAPQATALWVVPPPQSASGVLRAQVTVSASQLHLGDFKVPDKVEVRGLVELPSGAPAANVLVSAVPVAPLSELPLPASGATGTTDTEGHLRLALEPGHYRLDFSPVGSLPRSSRLVKVPAAPSSSGGAVPLLLEHTRLRQGVTVKGSVRLTSRLSTESGTAAFATVRFYRLSADGTSHLLLGETVTDAAGNYSVVLPTR